MTNEERERKRVEEQSQLANDIYEHLRRKDSRLPQEAIFPIDLVETFRAPQRPESLILSAIWLLFDQHRARLNSKLELELDGNP